jgi:hypothetical protein
VLTARVRALLLALPIGLAACDGPAAVATLGVNAASVALTGRAVPDLVVSAVTGRDCSVVRLDRRLSYCAPSEEAPAPPPFCTRSIGGVDCWVTRPPAVPMPPGVVQGPQALNQAQEADRAARWPRL